MQTGVGSIFKRIASHIAHCGGCMSWIHDFGATIIKYVFATISATFHLFLGVNPGTTSTDANTTSKPGNIILRNAA